MNQYIRTNDEGQSELNYDLLDMAARINFLEDCKQWADAIDVDLESEPDASDGEKAEAINDAATLTVKNQLYYLYDDEGNEVVIDQDTQQMIIDLVITELADRYSVENI